ncbi:hypothetical protein [Oceanobacillus sp. CAU 1775]
MQKVTERLHENKPIPTHTFPVRGWGNMNETSQPQQPEEIIKLEGKCGVITVLKHSHQNQHIDEDIHTLIARILLMKEKRLKATGE